MDNLLKETEGIAGMWLLWASGVILGALIIDNIIHKNELIWFTIIPFFLSIIAIWLIRKGI